MVAGAVVVQRPELFAASTIDYPALDMVRFDRFTGGRQWRSDFGSTDDPADFRALLGYSPYHGIKPGVCYPATLILPGDKDETTVPMHAYKFAAALQAAQTCDRPILLRVSWGAGHSSGATIDDSIDNWADQIAFLERVLDAPPR
jgi:prolyl oligopeptidase